MNLIPFLILCVPLSVFGEKQEHYNYGSHLIANEKTNFEDCPLRNSDFPIYSGIKGWAAVGGVPALPREFPHMAAIGWSQSDKTIKWLCGGSLITETFILTAAHCSFEDNIKPDKARMGDRNLAVSNDDQFVQEINIVEVIRHLNYSAKSSYYDIALFRLEKSIELSKVVCPACLWIENNFGDIPRLEAAGWGDLGFGEEKSSKLIKVELTPSDYQTCNEYYENNQRVKNGLMQHQMCAGDPIMDTCPGDSGGPLEKKLIFYNAKIPFIFGVVSFGPACGFETPAVYTKVSYFIDWIESKTNTSFDPIACAGRNYRHRIMRKPPALGKKSEPSLTEEDYFQFNHITQFVRFSPGLRSDVEIGTIEGNQFHKSCSGMLITEEYVLTSASCVSGKRSTHVDMRKAGKRVGIAAIIPHPKFDHARLANDIALVRLMDLALLNKNLYPTCFWLRNTIPENKKFEGYGVGPPNSGAYNYDENSSKNESFLFFLDAVDNLECNGTYVDKDSSISGNQICAGQNGTFLVPGSCELDPGSSLISRFNSSLTIIGVNSFGKNCGIGNVPAVFTKVSSYIEWMESIVFANAKTSVAPSSSEAVKKFIEFCVLDYRPALHAGEHPNRHSAVIGFHGDDEDNNYKCMGSLISSNMMITSAHCLESLGTNPDSIVLKVIAMDEKEETDKISPIQTFVIDQIINHPEYNPVTRSNDLALIRLFGFDKLSENLLPICLWQNRTHTPLGLFTVTAGTDDSALQTRRTTLVDISHCARLQQQEATTLDLCTTSIYDNESTALKSGDHLESKLHHPDRGYAVPYLIGINKFEVESNGNGRTNVYTRISEYTEWIVSVVMTN